jgi:hydroxyacylglutathione hydrolase
MQLLPDVYVVGGGMYGVGLSEKLDSNVYLIDGGSEVALVDCGVGVSTEKILDNVRDEGIDARKIRTLVLTHAHLDHCGGAAYLRRTLGLRVCASAEEADHLESGDEEKVGLVKARDFGIYPAGYRLESVLVDRRLRDRDTVTVGKYEIEVISTPGHSRGSICLLLLQPSKRVLFTGDTVFLRGLISVLNLPDSSLSDYRESIHKLEGLSIDALLPSHFGFCLGYGQTHLDAAIEALRGMSLPPMI